MANGPDKMRMECDRIRGALEEGVARPETEARLPRGEKLFCSPLRTMACAGGETRGPVMFSNFATKVGPRNNT